MAEMGTETDLDRSQKFGG